MAGSRWIIRLASRRLIPARLDRLSVLEEVEDLIRAEETEEGRIRDRVEDMRLPVLGRASVSASVRDRDP